MMAMLFGPLLVLTLVSAALLSLPQGAASEQKLVRDRQKLLHNSRLGARSRLGSQTRRSYLRVNEPASKALLQRFKKPHPWIST